MNVHLQKNTITKVTVLIVKNIDYSILLSYNGGRRSLMKRISTITLIGLLFLSGCSATTITGREGNYVYSQNEDITIIDIDTRDDLGILKITGAEVLIDDSFSVIESFDYDEDGEVIYESEVYEQLVQVFYEYDKIHGRRNISSANFDVYDCLDRLGENNPEIDPSIEYTIAQDSGKSYFLVALKNKSDFIDMNFKYDYFQVKNTAIIKLDITEESNNTSNEDSEVTNGEIQNESISTKRDQKPIGLYIIIGILSILLFTAITIIISLLRRIKR